MSKKGQKKGGQAARMQQQQQAAAKRRIAGAATGQRRTAVPRQQGEASDLGSRLPRATRYYLDVSAVRIQEWLARTPDLKFRRGASVLLTEATARDVWEGTLPPGTSWNDEAGDVGGVVSLVVADDAANDIADASANERLSAAALAVAHRMRELMPHCHIQAVAGTGESYADAYPQMEQARRDGRFLLDSPPAPPEVVLAKPCDQCRSAAATHKQILVIASEKPRDLCTDCRNRFDAAGGTNRDELRRSPLPERRMKDALAQAGMIVKGFSDNFAKMAAAGQRHQDDASTQLALIFADGNRVGAFLSKAVKAASASRKSPLLSKTEIARVIDKATIGALADAVSARFPNRSRPPVLANLAGGDDLLVSVPAADAWMFTRTLLASFGERVREAARAWPEQVRAEVPTLSAGIVFHHVKDPFSDVVRLAEEQLREAKQAGRGLAAMVAFVDLTADGAGPPPGRQPLSLSYLDKHAGELELIEQLPKSRIAALLALYRQGAGEDLIRRVTDLDNRPLWDVVAGPGAKPGTVKDVLTEHPGKRDELRRLLDLARHWTSTPTGAAA